MVQVYFDFIDSLIDHDLIALIVVQVASGGSFQVQTFSVVGRQTPRQFYCVSRSALSHRAASALTGHTPIREDHNASF